MCFLSSNISIFIHNICVSFTCLELCTPIVLMYIWLTMLHITHSKQRSKAQGNPFKSESSFLLMCRVCLITFYVCITSWRILLPFNYMFPSLLHIWNDSVSLRNESGMEEDRPSHMLRICKMTGQCLNFQSIRNCRRTSNCLEHPVFVIIASDLITES